MVILDIVACCQVSRHLASKYLQRFQQASSLVITIKSGERSNEDTMPWGRAHLPSGPLLL